MGRASTVAMVLVAGSACSLGLLAMGAGHAREAPRSDGRADAGAMDLPITSITLYRSGVGSFERRGTVTGDVRAGLRVDTDQINDLLKSMVLLDLDGGRVQAVSYESKDPLARRLSSFAIDISDNPSLHELLDRIRGARVSVRRPEGALAGTVVGVESSTRVKDGATELTRTLNLLTDDGVRQINLSNISGLEILDEDLARELRLALGAIGENRADNAKSVELAFEGEGQRRVVVSYVQEAPVWKASYRLVLPEDSASDATLQGWAIVENTTDEDWTDVRLSLVSGRPVSFTMDLYEPLYLPRYEAPVPVAAGARPRVYAEGRGGGGGQSPFSGRAEADYADDGLAAETRSAGRLSQFGKAAAPEMELSMMVPSSATMGSGAASGGEVGEQFHYQLDEAVTIERRRSAMLPILTEPAGARRVSIYTASDNSKHPMRGVELTNSTDLQLLAGPVSVYDAGAYAGDAQIGHVAPGDERLLAYAVDLDVIVDASTSQMNTVERIKIVRGLLEQTIKDEIRTDYELTSKDRSRGRRVIIEHPEHAGWDLVEPEAPVEKTDGALRFEVELAAGGTGELRVAHERVRRQLVEVLGFDMSQLVRYVSQGKASREVLDAVRRAGELQNAVLAVHERIRALESERREIGADQDRIRGNLGRVERGTELHERYLRKLNDQETRLEDIAESIEAARDQERAAQAALQEYVSGLSVE